MMLKVPVTAHDHRRGPDDALVTLVEYGDYECPACGMAQPVTKMLTIHFDDRLRFVFRNFPLAQVHPNAQAAAETAEFAATQGQFWEMHDALFENQARLGMPLFLALAEALRLPSDELADALAEGRYRSKVREDFMGGVRSGVNGTPTFFINDRRYDGNFAYESLAAAIYAELRVSAHTP